MGAKLELCSAFAEPAAAWQWYLSGVSYHDLQRSPRLLRELPAPERARLERLWQSARERQHTHLRAAIEQILSGVPLVLRGTVRKILG